MTRDRKEEIGIRKEDREKSKEGFNPFYFLIPISSFLN